MKKNLRYMRIILIAVAVALILIPIIIVEITDNGFREFVSQALISMSILSAIGAILIGADKQKKDPFFVKIGVCIGLLIVLLSLWI